MTSITADEVLSLINNDRMATESIDSVSKERDKAIEAINASYNSKIQRVRKHTESQRKLVLDYVKQRVKNSYVGVTYRFRKETDYLLTPHSVSALNTVSRLSEVGIYECQGHFPAGFGSAPQRKECTRPDIFVAIVAARGIHLWNGSEAFDAVMTLLVDHTGAPLAVLGTYNGPWRSFGRPRHGFPFCMGRDTIDFRVDGDVVRRGPEGTEEILHNGEGLTPRDQSGPIRFYDHKGVEVHHAPLTELFLSKDSILQDAPDA